MGNANCVPSFGLPRKPYTDGVATNFEQKTCFTNVQAIKFYGFDRLLTKVVTVGFGYVRDRTAV
ncbi:hypothetical protein Q5692_00450 [Microcoleus sp. C2C3]